MMDWIKFSEEVHQNAVEHGWWDEERSFGEIVSLCHSELSEALEEFRAKRPMVWLPCTVSSFANTPCEKDGCGDWSDGVCEIDALGKKPEGIAVELADCIIRIMDWFGKEKKDATHFLDRAKTQGVIQTGGTFGEFIAELHSVLTYAYDSDIGPSFHLALCVVDILEWAEENGVDMEAILRMKHEYNKGRPYRHGGKAL